MIGLKQVAILAHECMRSSLEPYGHEIIPATVGLCRHKTTLTNVWLCVDNFGIKHWSKQDANHLWNAIGAIPKRTVDKEGTDYCRLTLD